jgi:hypothetical protein
MDNKESFNEYLKEINSLTEHCIVEGNYTEGNFGSIVAIVFMEFVLSLKEDPFCNNAVLNPSVVFEMKNAELFKKYFGRTPSYNNTRTIFWAYLSK